MRHPQDPARTTRDPQQPHTPAETTRDTTSRAPSSPSETTRDSSPTSTTPHATTRDTSPAAAPPHATTRDAASPAGSGNVESTTRDAATPQHAPESSHWQLGALAQRFRVAGELPAAGAESDLLLLEDAAGVTFVLKLYRRGIHPDREVWELYPRLTSAYIVRTFETGTVSGRDYELLEYVPEGSLRDLAARHQHGVPMTVLTMLLTQLTDALECLHDHGVVHRDLKPENILVRRTEPLSVAVTDFGLSKTIDESMVFASSSRTLAYAAPESLSGQVSTKRDWWSVGMMMRELATGRKPFTGMTEASVIDHLATRPLEVDDVTDERLRLLCRGLLTRDPRRRWGASEIRAWLEGQSPGVATETVQKRSSQRSPLPFDGEMFTERAPLAAAFIEKWDTARDRFFSGMNNTTGPSEAWWTLREWMTQFNDAGDDVEGRIHLIDTYLSGQLPPDVKLLHLIRWLDPTLPPHFLGLRLTYPDLSALSSAAENPDSPHGQRALRIGRLLWDHRLLHILSGFSGGQSEQHSPQMLSTAQQQWEERVAAWGSHTHPLLTLFPHLHDALPLVERHQSDEEARVLLTLLTLATDPQADEAILTLSQQRVSEMPTPEPGATSPAWFETIRPTGTTPIGALAVLRCVPVATAEIEAERARIHAQQRAEEMRRQQWAEREARLHTGRPRAWMKALGWCALLIPTWLFLGLIARGMQLLAENDVLWFGAVTSSIAPPIEWFTLWILLPWALGTLLELGAATVQGADYMFYGGIRDFFAKLLRVVSWPFQIVARAVGTAADYTGWFGSLATTLFFALIGAVGATMVVAVVSSAPIGAWILFGTAVIVTHAITASVRVYRWRKWWRDERAAVLSGGQQQ